MGEGRVRGVGYCQGTSRVASPGEGEGRVRDWARAIGYVVNSLDHLVLPRAAAEAEDGRRLAGRLPAHLVRVRGRVRVMVMVRARGKGLGLGSASGFGFGFGFGFGIGFGLGLGLGLDCLPTEAVIA